MTKQYSFATNFLSLFSSNISSLLLGIITSLIVVRWLAPEGFGLKTVLTNFPILFVSFFEMGVRQSTIFFIGTKRYAEDRIFSSILTLWLFSSIIGLGIYFLMSLFQFKEIPIYLISISAVYIPIMIGQSFLSGLLLGKNMIRKLAILTFAYSFLTPVITILFLIVFDWGVFGVLLASQLVLLFTLWYRLFLLKRELNLKFKFSFELEVIISLFKHGIFYAIAMFLTSNFKLIPVFLMNGNISNYDIGIYSAGMAFAMLLNRIIGSTYPIIFAKGVNISDHDDYSKKIQVLFRVMTPILVIGVLLLFFLLPFLLPIIFGNKYVDSILITQILLFGFLAFAIQSFFIMDIASKGKPFVTVKAVTPAFLICIILNYIGIRFYGNIGAAISTTIALMVSCICYFYIYSKETKCTVWEIINPRRSDWIFLFSQIKTLRK